MRHVARGLRVAARQRRRHPVREGALRVRCGMRAPEPHVDRAAALQGARKRPTRVLQCNLSHEHEPSARDGACARVRGAAGRPRCAPPTPSLLACFACFACFTHASHASHAPAPAAGGSMPLLSLSRRSLSRRSLSRRSLSRRSLRPPSPVGRPERGRGPGRHASCAAPPPTGRSQPTCQRRQHVGHCADGRDCRRRCGQSPACGCRLIAATNHESHLHTRQLRASRSSARPFVARRGRHCSFN